MFRTIAAITVMLVIAFVGSGAFASSEQVLKAEQGYTLKPNTSLGEKDNLKTFCFSPVDSVTHYIGANIDDKELPDPLTLNPEAGNAWTVRLGAGVERHLGDNAAFDIDYRYISSPVELDFRMLDLPSGHEHNISAGMKFYF